MSFLGTWNTMKQALGLSQAKSLPPVGDDETEQRRQDALDMMKTRVAEFNVGLNVRIYRLEALAGVVIRARSSRNADDRRG